MSVFNPTPEQQAVLDHWGSGLAVIAGAGTGKTSTIIAKCTALLQNRPDAKILAITFTEKAAQELSTRLALKLGTEPESLGHFVGTIHGLSARIATRFPKEAGRQGFERLMSESDADDLWEEALSSLWWGALTPDESAALTRLLEDYTLDRFKQLLSSLKSKISFGILDHCPPDIRLVLSRVLSEWRRLKTKQGLLDFDDLEQDALTALDSLSVRKYFHKTYELVLVDEFQDTNLVQSRLVRQIVREDYSNLLVVGDPKQSIYAFRQADVSLFEELVGALPKTLKLTYNFRSTQKILNLVNEVCEPLWTASKKSYDSLVCGLQEQTTDEEVLALTDAEPDSFSNWILGHYSKGGQSRLGDAVILVRSVTTALPWIQSLMAHRIPLSIESGSSFWSDPRVGELVSFLNWWINPSERQSAAHFFNSPWSGCRREWIHEVLAQASSDLNLRTAFFKSGSSLAQILTAQGITEASGPMDFSLSEILLGILADEAIERECGQWLLSLWHTVAELQAAGKHVYEVVSTLKKHVAESANRRAVPPPEDEGVLRVMTIHSSKGLEFKHVYLLDFGTRAKDRSGGHTYYFDRHHGIYFPDPQKTSDELKEDQEAILWRERERLRAVEESKRLFYVALTRARERLVLVVKRGTKPFSDECSEWSDEDFQREISRDHWRKWIAVLAKSLVFASQIAESESNVLPMKSEHLVQIQKRDSKAVPKLIRTRHSVSDWVLANKCERSAMYRHRLLGEIKRGFESDVEVENKFDRGEFGTKVHACLANEDFERLQSLGLEVSKDFRGINESQSFLSQFNDFYKNHELAFEFKIGNAILVGAMDLVVLTGDTSATVVDYKVSLEDRSDETWKAAYESQLELYGLALAALEPRLDDIELCLVPITEKGIRKISWPLDMPSASAKAIQMAVAAEKRFAMWRRPLGDFAATPGEACRVCTHSKICPEARQF